MTQGSRFRKNFKNQHCKKCLHEKELRLNFVREVIIAYIIYYKYIKRSNKLNYIYKGNIVINTMYSMYYISIE